MSPFSAEGLSAGLLRGIESTFAASDLPNQLKEGSPRVLYKKNSHLCEH